MDSAEETHVKQHEIDSQQEWMQHFFPCTKNDLTAQLFLKAERLQISIKDKIQTSVLRSDLIGFECKQLEFQSYSIDFHLFPKVKKLFKKQKRQIEHFTIKIQASCDMMESIKVILLRYITNRRINSSKELLKILIVFNPRAGSNSKLHLEKIINFLKYTNFVNEIMETTHKNHLRQFLDNQQTSQYCSILIVSGDGLIHQFANSKVADRIPISHVPAGSGNGFAKSQSDIAGQICDDQIAIYLLVKGRIKEMNLVAMQLENHPNIIYSFLSLQWAFLADIDMNSQFLRIFGGLRFEMYSLYCLLVLKKYTAKLTYSQQTTNLPPLNEPITNPLFKQIDTNFLNVLFCSTKFISDKYEFAPLLNPQQKVIDMQVVTEEQGRWQFIKYLLASEKGSHFDRQEGKKKENFNFIHAKIKSYRLQPSLNAQNKGIFGIDGEKYEAQRMQAAISDKRMKTFV